MKRLPALLILCACNELDDAAQCMFTPEPGTVGTCLLPQGADSGLDPSSLEAVTLVGATVTAAGRGAPASGCVELDSWLGLADRSQDSDMASWLELEDADGQSWTLAVMVPDAALGLDVGEPVDLSWRWAPGDAIDLQLRDAEGRLLAWVGRAAEPAQLWLPNELLVEEGAQIQACAEDCGVMRYTELHAELDGESAELGWDQTRQLGDYLLAHAGTVATNDDACQLADCAMGTALAVVLAD